MGLTTPQKEVEVIRVPIEEPARPAPHPDPEKTPEPEREKVDA